MSSVSNVSLTFDFPKVLKVLSKSRVITNPTRSIIIDAEIKIALKPNLGGTDGRVERWRSGYRSKFVFIALPTPCYYLLILHIPCLISSL